MMPNTAYAQNAYTHAMVNTSTTPLDLVILLYDGAIGFLNKASLSMKDNNVSQKTQYITRTMAIVEELLASLDHEAGGEIAESLQSLYLYMQKELTIANITNDAAKIRQIEALLKELRTAWREIR
ncbi:MAG: flagellar export chaperone FliS [Actinobacteria bacterium]|nr:flagellar export chaperone FliS [Actinomycetota bacterium]